MAVVKREKELYDELDQVNDAIQQLCNHRVFLA
jgi:hypothetical protein